MIYQTSLINIKSSYIHSFNTSKLSENLSSIDGIAKNLECTNTNEYKINSEFKNLKFFISEVFNLLKKNSKIQNDLYLKYFIDELKKNVEEYLSQLKKYYISKKKIHSDNYEMKNGFYKIQINDNIIDEILILCSDNLNNFRNNIRNGLIKRENLSINTGWKIRKIINILNAEFNKIGVNEQVSFYMQKKYQVISCALELSTPFSKWWKNTENVKSSNRTNYAHVDESFLYPKSILYLTDVNKNNGPTSFYPNIYKNLGLNFLQDIIGRVVGNIGQNKKSKLFNYYKKKYHQPMSCGKFQNHFSFLPSELRFNSHFGWDIQSESALEGDMIQDENFITGKKGTCVIFDGARILHRGGLIEEGERIVLQIVFGIPENYIVKIINKITRKISEL